MSRFLLGPGGRVPRGAYPSPVGTSWQRDGAHHVSPPLPKWCRAGDRLGRARSPCWLPWGEQGRPLPSVAVLLRQDGECPPNRVRSPPQMQQQEQLVLGIASDTHVGSRSLRLVSEGARLLCLVGWHFRSNLRVTAVKLPFCHSACRS